MDEAIADGTFRDKNEAQVAIAWIVRKGWGRVEKGTGGVLFCTEDDVPDTEMTKVIVVRN